MMSIEMPCDERWRHTLFPILLSTVHQQLMVQTGQEKSGVTIFDRSEPDPAHQVFVFDCAKGRALHRLLALQMSFPTHSLHGSLLAYILDAYRSVLFWEQLFPPERAVWWAWWSEEAAPHFGILPRARAEGRVPMHVRATWVAKAHHGCHLPVWDDVDPLPQRLHVPASVHVFS